MRSILWIPCVLGIAWAAPTEARTWRVPGEVPTIGAAFALCSEGDTVLVADGVFTGPGNRGLMMPPVNIVLRSSGGPEACTIDCESEAKWLTAQSGQSRDTVIEGFRVIHGHDTVGGAIAVVYASLIIRSCLFEENTGSAGGALYCTGPDALIEDCRFRNNGSSSGGSSGGAAYLGFHPSTFRRCLFDHNRANHGGAITAVANGPYTLEDCTISDNHGWHEAGAINSMAPLILRRCIVYGNSAGGSPDEIYALGQIYEPECCDLRRAGMSVPGWTYEDCIDADPLFCDAAEWPYPDYPSDYHLRGDSPCLPEGSPCGLVIGAFDVGCYPPGWPGACCFPDGSCVVEGELECQGNGGQFQGGAVPCEPNPCVPTPVEKTTWGKIKVRFR